MVFIIYLAIFLAVLAYRRYVLTGSFLKETYVLEKHTTYLDAKTNKSKNSFTQHYGLLLNRRMFFSITPERWYHRLLKFMGLATEIETGHADLDKKLFFVSDAPEHFQELLKTPEQQQRIAELFDSMKIHGLRAFGDKLWLSCEGVENNTQHRDERLAILWQIAGDIEQLPPSWDSALNVKSFGFPHFAMLFMACHAALLAMGLCGWFPTAMEDSQIVNWSPIIRLCFILLPLLPILWLLLVFKVMDRQNSWTSLVVIDFIVFGLAGLILSGVLLAREANIRLDRSQGQVMVQPMISKDCQLKCKRRSGKRSRSSTYMLNAAQCLPDKRAQTLQHYEQIDYKCSSSAEFKYTLFIQPWASYQKGPFSLDTDSALYDRAQNGMLFQVPVYDGAFGAEWVDTAEILPVTDTK